MFKDKDAYRRRWAGSLLNFDEVGGVGFWIFVLMVATALVTAALGCVFHGDVYRSDRSVAPLWRIFLSSSLLALCLWTANALGKSVDRIVRRRWWNMGTSSSANAPGWEALINMLCNDEYDPLSIEGGKRPIEIKSNFQFRVSASLIASALSVFSLGIMFGIFLDYIIYPRVPKILIEKAGLADVANMSQNLTAYLAMLGAVVTIVFTYQQLRAKVRASSRQKWITKVRRLTANVLSNIDDVINVGKSSDSFQKFNSSRTHLELHLNPSESDHRLLMFLIRACAFPALLISNDQVVLLELKRVLSKVDYKDKDKYRFEAIEDLVSAYTRSPPHSIEWRRAVVCEHKDEIISFIFKLSHAILKREWERVRYTQ